MDKVIKEYISVFGELPPADAVISYYDKFYQDLMKKAIKSGKKITAETLAGHTVYVDEEENLLKAGDGSFLTESEEETAAYFSKL